MNTGKTKLFLLKGFPEVIIFGQEEKDKGVYKIKNMSNGEEQVFSL